MRSSGSQHNPEKKQKQKPSVTTDSGEDAIGIFLDLPKDTLDTADYGISLGRLCCKQADNQTLGNVSNFTVLRSGANE